VNLTFDALGRMVEQASGTAYTQLLTDAGWIVQDKRATNLSAGRGVAVGEFPLKSGYGEADYLLFVDAAPIGVVEAKKEGDTLTGVELQTTKYSEGVPDNLTTPRLDGRCHSSTRAQA